MKALVLVAGSSVPAQLFARLEQALPTLCSGESTHVVLVFWMPRISFIDIWQAVGARFGEFPMIVDDKPFELSEQVEVALPTWATPVSKRVLRQASIQSLLELIQFLDADLLVVGKPNRLTLKDLLTQPGMNLEFNLDEVIRRAPIPVLVMPHD